MQDLPALSSVVTDVIRALRNPDCTVAELADVLGRDQALTARVLRLANSALFGLPRRIGALTDAIVLLGFNTVRSLSVAGSAFTVMDRSVVGYGLQRGLLWRHGVAAAAAARLLASRVAPQQVEEAFVAGLLHDIGKIVLDSYVGQAFDEIARIVAEHGAAFADAEREVLGFDHAQVGGLVAEKWALPQDLVAAIRYHHEPLTRTVHWVLPSLVHVANAAVLSARIGVGADVTACEAHEEVISRLGLSQEDMGAVACLLSEASADSDQYLGLGWQAG